MFNPVEELHKMNDKEIRAKLVEKHGEETAELMLSWCRLNDVDLEYLTVEDPHLARPEIFDSKTGIYGTVIKFDGNDTITYMSAPIYEKLFYDNVTACTENDDDYSLSFDFFEGFTENLYMGWWSDYHHTANVNDVYKAEMLLEALFGPGEYDYLSVNYEDEDDEKEEETKTYKVDLDFFE